MNENAFQRLLELAPPPDTTVNAGSPDGWGPVEQALGTSLPPDYKRLINTYGSGEFCDLLVLLNPFSKSKHGNFLKQVGEILDQYYEGREEYATEKCPFPAFPDPGGLLPAGGDSNGGNLFWIMTGPPDEWPIVLYNWRGGYIFERHDMPLVDFLVGWLSGSISDCFFGAGIDSPIIKRDPVFCPAGMIRPSPYPSRDGEKPFRSEEAYWSAHAYHNQGLTCGHCGAERDFSAELDVTGVACQSPETWITEIEARAKRAVERARRDGWRLVGYVEMDPNVLSRAPYFLCPACAGAVRR
jgi:hypothetical protein